MKKYIFISITILGICFSKAQIGINTNSPEGPLHINANSESSTNKDVIITEEGKIGIGNLTPIASVDARSNNSSNNAIAVGNTIQSATSAGTGAVRWNGSNLQYSNGSTWNDIPSVTPNAFVIAEKSSSQVVNNSSTNTINIINWTEKTDVTDSFDFSTGIFTANKEGRYLVTFSFEFSSSLTGQNAYVETILESNRTTNNIEKFKCVSSYPGNTQSTIAVTGSCTGIFNLLQGNTIRPVIRNMTGSDRNLSTDNTKNTLTIFGL